MQKMAPRPQTCLDKLLGSHPLLGALSREARRKLASVAVLRRLKPGETLVALGDPVDSIWITAEGLVYGHVQTPEGKPVTLELFTPGDMFGVTCLLAGGRYSFNVTAISPAIEVGLPIRGVLNLAGGDRRLCEAFLTNAALRVRRLAEMRIIAAERSEARIPAVLCWLHEILGPRVPLTLAMIGTIAGVSRETVSRSMAPLRRRGWLSINRGLIGLIHPQKLRRGLRAMP